MKKILLLFLFFPFISFSQEWTQVGGDIDGEQLQEQSGGSVSLSSDGTIVAIAAKWHNIEGGDGDVGTVRVYQYISNTWSKLGNNIDGKKVSELFGHSVFLSGDGTKVAIGVFENPSYYPSSPGLVRVYEYTNNSWSQLGNDIIGEASQDRSGGSVSLSSDGTIVAIGAVGNENGKGHVRVYKYIGGVASDTVNTTWTKLGQDIDGEASQDQSGGSVSLSGNGTRVAIGAQYNDDGPGNDAAGHTRVLHYPVTNIYGMNIVSSQVVGVYCEGDSTGSITLELEGEVGDLTIDWSNGEDSLSIYNLSDGTYSVTITDSVGQTVTEEYVVGIEPKYLETRICYVTADSIDYTKNRIFINVGPAPHNIEKYILSREGSIANNFEIIGEISSSEESYLDENIDNRSQSYRYKVSVKTYCGEVYPGSVEDDYHETSHLSANKGISGEVNLSWTEYKGIEFSTYEIYRKVNDENFEFLTSVSSNFLSYSDFSVNSDNSYKYYVAVLSEVSCGPGGGVNIEYDNPNFDNHIETIRVRSNIFDLDTDFSPLFVESVSLIEKIYPNPTNDNLTIILKNNSKLKDINFIDFSGKILKPRGIKINNERIDINISNFNNGVYILELITDRDLNRVKIVIE